MQPPVWVNLSPAANQRLVADVDRGLVLDRPGRVGRDERDAGGAKGVEDRAKVIRGCARLGAELLERQWPADRRALRIDAGESAERGFDRLRAPITGRDRRHHLVRVARQKLDETLSVIDNDAVEFDLLPGQSPFIRPCGRI